jgi:hypothetical protein
MLQESEWKIDFDVDEVLRAQGADPQAVRTRSAHLVDVAQAALQEGLPFLKPRTCVARFRVNGIQHHRLKLENDHCLSGPLITQQLAASSEIVAALCTIGPQLEAHISQVMPTDLMRGLALDGVGSAAVEALANALCSQLEMEAKAAGMQTTVPLSPGMEGWPVEVGQQEIFALLEADSIGITLMPSQMMIPRKSLSMVVGVGRDVVQSGSACDYCTMKDTCRYRDPSE